MGRTCVCFNLRRAARAVTQLFDEYFDLVGLKATQFIVLAALMNVSNGDAATNSPTVTSLADALLLDQSSLSRNLAVLERLGYVRLVPGVDRRERMVTLTRTGRTALAKGYPVWKRAQGAITGALESGEFETQLRSLRRMTRSALSLRVPKPRGRHAAVTNQGLSQADLREERNGPRNGPRNGTKSASRAASRARRVS